MQTLTNTRNDANINHTNHAHQHTLCCCYTGVYNTYTEWERTRRGEHTVTSVTHIRTCTHNTHNSEHTTEDTTEHTGDRSEMGREERERENRREKPKKSPMKTTKTRRKNLNGNEYLTNVVVETCLPHQKDLLKYSHH